MQRVLGILLLAAAAACAPVREDRTIEWSARGTAVGFQHGPEGIYVADGDGGRLSRIHRPDKDVLATSAPLWSPTDERRLLFTTARAEDGRTASARLPLLFAPDPAGDLLMKVPVIYTCWLKEPGDDEPTALFEARLDHVGYVAANLAARWHPSGTSVLFLRRTQDSRHALYEYDLARRTTRRAFPHEGEAFAFDWTPDGTRLVCALAGAGRADGIWIVAGEDAWHICTRPPHGDSPIDGVRALRPAWTRDGRRFAFAAGSRAGCRLVLGDTRTRRTKTLARGGSPFTDLHWSPDGRRLGAVEGDALRLFDLDGDATKVNDRPVRHFAGWNAAGTRLAYVVPDRIPLTAQKERWSLMILADALARDALLVAPGDGSDPGREAFAGMRVTFPRWSPRDDKLTLWFTYGPTHRSILSRMLGWGLLPGDPAAVFRPADQTVAWMAVDAFERAQIGHYHLLRRENEEAWRWYERARREAGDGGARKRGDVPFFEHVCLARLGRAAEARRKLATFREEFAPFGDFDLTPSPLVHDVLRDVFAAEVFLSLDSAGEAEAYLADANRLSAKVVRAQIALLQERYDVYVDRAASFAPRLLAAATRDAQIVELVAAFALLPLLEPEFLERFPDARVEALARTWDDLRRTLEPPAGRALADRMLAAACERLGRSDEAEAARNRSRGVPGLVFGLMQVEGLIRFARTVR